MRKSKLLLSLLMIVTLMPLSAFSLVAKEVSSTNFGDKLITEVKLLDQNETEQKEYGFYDDMQINWKFAIPQDTSIKNGNEMLVKIPEEFNIASSLSFNIMDENNNIYAAANVNKGARTISIVFNQFAEDHSSSLIDGNFSLWVRWNSEKVTPDENVTINWNDSLSVQKYISPENDPSKNEKLFKWGWYDSNDAHTIHWRVRINYANQNLAGAVYNDYIGEEHELVDNSINAYTVTYNEDGSDFTTDETLPDDVISIKDKKNFAVNLKDISKAIIIDYSTKITDDFLLSKYENEGNLVYNNNQQNDIDTFSPSIGGNGDIIIGAKTKVNGKIYWLDHLNVKGERPESVVIKLYRNDKEVDSKEVDASNFWKYEFNNLPKYDQNGKIYDYKVEEQKIEHYVIYKTGKRFINVYNPDSKYAL